MTQASFSTLVRCLHPTISNNPVTAKFRRKSFKVLVADNYPIVCKAFKLLLSRYPEFNIVVEVTQGSIVPKLIGEVEPELILLDPEMPGLRITETIKSAKNTRKSTKIIIICSQSSSNSIRGMLEAGVDDFVFKTEDTYAILKRIQSICSEKGQEPTKKTSREDYEKQVRKLENRDLFSERKYRLSQLEYRVLSFLRGRAGKPASTSELLINIWGATIENGGTKAQVWNCIRRLRTKIEDDPGNPKYLRTIGNWGYLLEGYD